MYDKIKENLGEKWLEVRQNEINSGKWVPESVENKEVWMKKKSWIISKALDYIDKTIELLEDVPGFDDWVHDAKTSDNFEDFLLELVCFEELACNRNNDLTLKLDNDGSVPDAFVTSQGQSFFAEITNIHELKGSSDNFVNGLFKKAKRQFGGGQGIVFVGMNSLGTTYSENGDPNYTVRQKSLFRAIDKRFTLRKSEYLLCILLTNAELYVNPDTGEFAMRHTHSIFRRRDKRTKEFSDFIAGVIGVDKVRNITY